jgi:hypothetical protein
LYKFACNTIFLAGKEKVTLTWSLRKTQDDKSVGQGARTRLERKQGTGNKEAQVGTETKTRAYFYLNNFFLVTPRKNKTKKKDRLAIDRNREEKKKGKQAGNKETQAGTETNKNRTAQRQEQGHSGNWDRAGAGTEMGRRTIRETSGATKQRLVNESKTVGKR